MTFPLKKQFTHWSQETDATDTKKHSWDYYVVNVIAVAIGVWALLMLCSLFAEPESPPATETVWEQEKLGV